MKQYDGLLSQIVNFADDFAMFRRGSNGTGAKLRILALPSAVLMEQLECPMTDISTWGRNIVQAVFLGQ